MLLWRRFYCESADALILTPPPDISGGEPIRADQSSDRHHSGASVLLASHSSGSGVSRRLEPEPSPDMEWQLSRQADVNAIPVHSSSASSLLASSACYRRSCPPGTGLSGPADSLDPDRHKQQVSRSGPTLFHLFILIFLLLYYTNHSVASSSVISF